MSTIAYRDGVMAADTRAFAGYNGHIGQKTKIRRLGDGTLIGCSTNQVGVGEVLLDWYARGATKPYPELEDNNFTLLVVKPDGTALYANNSFLFAGPLTDDFFSIGSGCEWAQGAMFEGATAERAIEVAAHFDVWTATPVLTLTHSQ